MSSAAGTQLSQLLENQQISQDEYSLAQMLAEKIANYNHQIEAEKESLKQQLINGTDIDLQAEYSAYQEVYTQLEVIKEQYKLGTAQSEYKINPSGTNLQLDITISNEMEVDAWMNEIKEAMNLIEGVAEFRGVKLEVAEVKDEKKVDEKIDDEVEVKVEENKSLQKDESPWNLTPSHNLSGKKDSETVKYFYDRFTLAGKYDYHEPVYVVQIGQNQYILDGHHRVYAAKLANVDVTIEILSEHDALIKFPQYGSLINIVDMSIKRSANSIKIKEINHNTFYEKKYR